MSILFQCTALMIAFAPPAGDWADRQLKAFTEQATTLNQRLSGLTDAVIQTKQMAEQQLLQQRDIAALKSRLNAVEKERAEKPANAASTTPAAVEEKW